MRARTVLATAAATLMAVVGLTATTAAPANAAVFVNCGNVGATGSPNTYYYTCDLEGVTATDEFWTGITVTSGQGTASAHGICVLVASSRAYHPQVQYRNAAGQTVTATAPAFLCNGMAGY